MFIYLCVYIYIYIYIYTCIEIHMHTYVYAGDAAGGRRLRRLSGGRARENNI